MTLRIRMYPHLDDIQPLPTNGISQVVKQYFKHLPNYDIELVPVGEDDNIDIVAVHAGAIRALPHTIPVVAHNHGLYWTADDPNMGIWTDEMNEVVIKTVRHASLITVPSTWVAKVFERDMHLKPVVLPHGVNWDEWQEPVEDGGYVLWNKNRATDACDPSPVNNLSARAPKTRFLTTYAAPNPRPNVRQTGTVDFATMKQMILNCSVYLATTKETFGIGTLEAMAAGKPILGFDYGGTADLVKHGYNGYIAEVNNYDDLLQGLDYCFKHAKNLGENSRKHAKLYTWDNVAKQLAHEYALTVEGASYEPRVTVVIPMYNKAGTVLRAIRSVLAQTRKPDALCIVNNNSTDDFRPQIDQAFAEAEQANVQVEFTNCYQQGVAHTRNYGISMSAGRGDFVVCLDADDEMLPEFVEKCYRELAWDESLGIVYTGMEVVNEVGQISASQWPGEYNADGIIRGRNQVPTCCMFRREAWERAGGYRQRYAPNGAGSEDADLWLRIALVGYGAKQAVPYPLFRYYLGGLVSGNSEYREVDWRYDKAWLATGQFPFAATFTPTNHFAHAVRQYDQPELSIVIPVSVKHIDLVIDAIDSIEAQTFRKWELILVADGHTRQGEEKWERLQASFPFIKFQTTYEGYEGAGAARNLGAEMAKSPLLLFLDADDWLVPTALEEMMDAYNANQDTIVYTDYYGHAYIQDANMLTRLQSGRRLIDYNQKTKEAKVLYTAYDFDCNMAQAQPMDGRDPYIWNVISSIVPRKFHEEIGGFDVQMESWEDWDYWVRLAKAGKCFTHLAKPLLEYRFYTGERRSLANPGESGESGRQLSAHLLEYMRNKYREIENMPCGNCKGHRSTPSAPPIVPMSLNQGRMSNMSASDMVTVELIDGNLGDHLIAFGGTSYGYRVSGDRFSMQQGHAVLDRRVRIINDSVVQPNAQPLPPPPPVAAPVIQQPKIQPLPKPVEVEEEWHAPSVIKDDPETAALRQQILSELEDAEEEPEAPKQADLPNAGPKPYDFKRLWGINEERAGILLAAGVRTLDGLMMLGAPRIQAMLNCNALTATRIITEAEKVKEASTKKNRPATKVR